MSLRLGLRLGRAALRPLASRSVSLARPAARLPLPTLTLARYLSSTPHGDPAVAEGIAVREYHHMADKDMDILHESLEILCEDFAPSDDWEVEYSSGVMNLSIPGVGTYVINKQPPNHQIWVSSPISGPARFSMSPDGVWVHHRLQGVRLGKLLEDELRSQVGESGEDWEGVGLQ